MAILDLNKSDRKRLRDAVRKVESTTEGPEWKQRFDAAAGHVFVKIISSSQTSSYKWSYTGRPMKVDTQTGALVEDTSNPDIVGIENLCEKNNLDANGYAGNGVNPANLPTGFMIQPLSRGTPILELFLGRYVSMTNGVDGEC